MANPKALTEAALANALKDLRKQIRNDAFEDRTEFFNKMTVPAIKQMGKELRGEIGELRKEVKRNTNQISWMRDDIKGLKADLSTTASKGEVHELRQQLGLAS